MSKEILQERLAEALEEFLDKPDLPEGSISPLHLARWVVGDLPKAESGRVAQLVAADPDLQARSDAMRLHEAAFEQKFAWEEVKDSIKTRAEAMGPLSATVSVSRRQPSTQVVLRRAKLGWAMLAGALGGLAVLALTFMVPASGPDAGPWTSPSPLENRYKSGSDALGAFILVDGRTERIDAGQRLAAGTVLQFRVSTPHSRLVLLGVDGTGTVSRYLPIGGETSARFTPGNGVPLADALQLDAAPGPEVFVAFLSDETLLVEELEQAIHDATADGGGVSELLSPRWAGRALAPQVEVFHIEKE